MTKLSELTNILYLKGRLITIDSDNYSNRNFPRRVTNDLKNLQIMKRIIHTPGKQGSQSNLNIQAVMSSLLKTLFSVLFIFVFSISFGADRYWVTGGNGQWGSTTNWSNFSGGASGQSVPGINDVAIFDANSGVPNVTFNVAPAALGQLWITDNRSVTYTSAGGAMTLTVGDNNINSIAGASVANADFVIESGSTLNITGPSAANTMTVTQNNNANSQAIVIGTIQVNANGILTKAANPPFIFNAGSTYSHNRDAGTIVTATWNATSNCNIIGIINTTLAGGLNQTFGNLTIDGSSSLTAAVALAQSGNVTVQGNLIIIGRTAVNTMSLNPAANNLTAAGTTTINSFGLFIDNANGGTNTFTGAVTINANGTLSTANTSSYNFAGGITNNGTISQTAAGAITFTATQSLSGIGTMAFAGAVTIGNNFAVTSSTTVSITGALIGGNASSTWVNSNNATLNYSNAANPMATGVFTASANPNTVNYALNGVQAINGTTYNILTLSGNNTKNINGATVTSSLNLNGAATLAIGANSLTATSVTRNNAITITISTGTFTVNGNLLLNAADPITLTGAGILNVSGNLTCGTLTGSTGTINIGGTFSPNAYTINTSTVNYNASGSQNVFAYTYYNLSISGGGTKTLQGAVTVNNILTLTSGILQLGSNNLIVSNNAAAAITGYSATSYIETNSTGYLQKNGNSLASFQITYPVGSGGYYSPMIISATTQNSGNIKVRAVTSGTLGSRFISKYWDVTSTVTPTVTVTFQYDPAEATVSPTIILFQPNAGIWQNPTGTKSFGANSFTVTGTNNITTTSSWWTAGAPGAYYSYQTGDWNTPTTWTSDPGGTTQVGSTVPGINDVVVILSGRTVSLSGNIATSNLDITINNGGFLDLSTFQFSSGLLALRGEGTLKLASTNFPTAITNTFINTGGGTTEYNNASNFTLPAAQATYNNLTINANGVIATQLSNIALNGNLYIKQGTYRINDDVSTTKRNLIINGNVTVDNGAFFTVGKGPTNTTTTPTGIVTTFAPPFINYYEQFHRVVINGNFTNNGTVKFTNLTYPVFNAFPPIVAGATSGAASVYFMGATDNTLTCNGTTDFYNLILDKGIDQTFKLTVYSLSYTNFRLFGANIADCDIVGATNNNPNLKKALWIRTGTLVLEGLIVIPSLSEGTIGPVFPTSDFYLPSNGALILVGTDVVVLATADSYDEVNAAYGVSGGTGLVNGVGQGGYSSVSILGKLQINNGYLSTRESGGLITWNWASGQFVINGGTADAKQFQDAGLSSYEQTGGTLILRGRFQRTPSSYTSVSDLVNAPLNTARATNGITGTVGTLNINSAANVFSMSDGTIRIYDVCGTTAPTYAVQINSSSSNINVTGGTLELIPTTGTVLADVANYMVYSTAPFGNLLINQGAGCASVIQLNTYPLIVLQNLTLQAGTLDANNLNVSVGGNISIANGTVYTPGTNWTILNGSGSQNFTINLAAPLTLKKLKVDKPAGSILTLAGTQMTVNVSDSVMLLNGTFADGGKTINFTTSATTTTSYLYNSGIHTGTGKISLSDDDPQVINGDGNGVFQNLELNNTDALAAPVSLAVNTTINGTLTFSQDKLFNIISYNLALGSSATIVNGGANRYIQTSGGVGDGGLTIFYPSAAAITFPVGAPSTRHATANYTPAVIGFSSAPTMLGSITVIPVGYEHPATTTNGRSLTYFWRVKSTGFTLGAATVTHGYTYSQNDVVTGGDVTENGYVAARYNAPAYTWTKGTVDDVDDAVNNIIGEPGAGTFLENVTFIDGDYTAGDDNATNPFGTPIIYYSRQGGLWGTLATWSLTSHTVNNPPAVVPGINDIVIIGGQDSVYLATNNTIANTGVQNCASLQIEAGSALDIGYNPGCNFGMVQTHPNGNGNFRLTTSWTSGSTYTFPSGDFSDFNINLGTTELYSTNPAAGTTYWLPQGVLSYGNLILSPLGGSNIIFANNNLTIYGNLITRGQNADSWFCPTWNVNYPTPPTARIAKTITIKGNLDIQGGALIWYENGALAQNFIIDGNVTVATLSALYVWSGGTNQSMAIGGSLINNTDGLAHGLTTTSKCDFTNIPVTFFGSTSASITNTGGTALTIFNQVTINKGTSQATTLTCDIGGTLTTLANNWLTLQNGTFRYMRTNPSSDFTISTTTPLTIPATAGLYINYSNSGNRNILIANSASNTNDLFLNGKLTLINGNVYVGPTSGASAFNNDIEYSGGGASEIEVQGGNLVVNGQIRRNPATTDGVLTFTQSGGAVIINGNAAITSNAKFEILNSGSSFTMSGGMLTIVRGGGGNTYGDLYLRPETSSVTGGEIIFTQIPGVGPVVDAVQNYLLDATIPLNNLTITGKIAATARNATVKLLINPLVLNGTLKLTNANSIFDANSTFNIDVTIKGNFDNSGTYNHFNNLTTFNGGTQTITGTSASDFYDLDVSPVTSLTLGRDATVNHDLFLGNGTLACGAFRVNVKGDVTNNATYTDTNTGLILNGTTKQHLTGTGTYGRLELNNAAGARLESNTSLQNNLVLTQGIIDINKYLLTLGQNSDITGGPFSTSKMIISDGVFSNVGIRKFFNTGAATFTYPLGVAGKYTPAVFTITASASVGSIRLNNINDNHPGVFDPDNVLKYYWEVESSSISGFSGSLVLNYLQGEVQGALENQYVAARLIIPGTSWSKAAPGPTTDNVDETNNTITFTHSGSDNLSGEYTAGTDAAIPVNVPTYTSNADGNWTDNTKWTQTGGDTFPCPLGGPNGFIVIVDHIITADANNCFAYRTTINNEQRIIIPTFGHNLGTVDGSGTLYLESAIIPAGRYTAFFDCSNSSTLEYGGTGSYTLIADLYDNIPKLAFSGSGTRILPNKDLVICKQLKIDGPTLDNSVYNRKLTIQGTMERYNTGIYTSGTGAGAAISFAGSTAQTIGGSLGDFTGTNAFNNFEINNSSGLTINTNGAIDVNSGLLLTNGLINTSSTNKLTITNTAINCVTPAGGSASSYINGPLIKKINQGDNFQFPIGKNSYLGNKLTLSSTQTGTILWTAEYFNPNPTYASYLAPLTDVNAKEYWTVIATAGNQAFINLDWDPLSNLTPLMTQNGLSDMRVAEYDGSSWLEIASTATGDDYNGTVSTSSRVTLPASGTRNYSVACINTVKPKATLTPTGPVCGTAGIPVTFTSPNPAFNYTLSYTINSVAQTPVVVSSLPYSLPTLSTGGIYKLTGFTYNGGAGTGVVDPGTVTTYAVPTTANAGLDQSLCGATSATLAGNTPTVGTGLWTIVGGTGGTVVTPTSPTSTFTGTNGTSYTLRWTISNGGCTSSDDVVINLALNPVQPAAYTTSSASVCQGQTSVVYTVPNDPTVTYNWSYSGSGATINGTGNSVTVDFDVTATSGTLSVTATNGCGTSAPRDLAITVHRIPETGPTNHIDNNVFNP